MMTATNSCVAGKVGVMQQVPEKFDYDTRFEFDWDVYESGTYSYGPEGRMSSHMGKTRARYQVFFDLTLDFRFKDGREYHEKIDTQSLIRKMMGNYEIPDMTKTKQRRKVSLIVRIERDRLAMDYLVSEHIVKEKPKRQLSKRRLYPVFEKMLD